MTPAERIAKARFVVAPFTPEQVASLNAWQANTRVHPFTCGNRDDHPQRGRDYGILTATVDGWVCQDCDYTQDWAHAFMAGAS